MRTFRPLLALASFAVLLPAGATPAFAGGIQLIEVSPAGWVVVRTPGVASYTPAAKDRGNTYHGGATVKRVAKGQWTITWPGLTAPAGAGLQVNALGTKPRHCLAWTWTNGPDATADVYCYKRVNDPDHGNVAPVDTPFVAAWTGMLDDQTGTPGRLAYAWVGDGDSDSTPNLSYNHINNGEVIHVLRTGVGRYTVVQPGIGKGDGTPQVTGYLGDPRRCQIRGWALSGADLHTKVDCFDMTGVAADAEFDYLYTRHLGLTGFSGSPDGASLLADWPIAASYHPVAGLAWSSAGKAATISRLSKGVYAVKLPGMTVGGAAIVTPFGPHTKPRTCQIGAIRTSGTPQVVQVRCFTFAGAPADTRFTFTYTR